MPAIQSGNSVPKQVKYDQKSGVVSTGDYVTMHGGLPSKKSVEAIDKENTPKKVPSAVGK
jgi:hypothetical protein